MNIGDHVHGSAAVVDRHLTVCSHLRDHHVRRDEAGDRVQVRCDRAWAAGREHGEVRVVGLVGGRDVERDGADTRRRDAGPIGDLDVDHRVRPDGASAGGHTVDGREAGAGLKQTSRCQRRVGRPAREPSLDVCDEVDFAGIVVDRHLATSPDHRNDQVRRGDTGVRVEIRRVRSWRAGGEYGDERASCLIDGGHVQDDGADTGRRDTAAARHREIDGRARRQIAATGGDTVDGDISRASVEDARRRQRRVGRPER